MLQTLKLTMTGSCEAVIHNGQTANPLNSFSKRLKMVSRKRNKTDEDIETMAKIEFEAGWYLNNDQEYILPAHNIEAVILEGAKRARLGKQMQSGCFVETDPMLKFKGSDKTVDELWEGGKHALVASVRIKNSRVIRTRPLIPRGWKSDLTVKYDPAVIEPEQIVTALETAGREIGIGDWRPKYGRFTVSQ